MKNCKSLVIAFLFICLAWGQSFGQASRDFEFASNSKASHTKDFHFAAKLGGSMTWRVWDPLGVLTNGSFLSSAGQKEQLKWDRFRFAFQVQRKSGHIHEFSFLPKFNPRAFYTSDPQTGPLLSVRSSNLSMGYGYFVDLFKSKRNQQFGFYLGFQANPYLSTFKLVPINSTAFRQTDRFLGIQGKVVPRLAWYSSKRFFADLSLEFTMADAFVAKFSTNNPTSLVSERTYYQSQFSVLPNMHSIVASIGMKI